MLYLDHSKFFFIQNSKSKFKFLKKILDCSAKKKKKSTFDQLKYTEKHVFPDLQNVSVQTAVSQTYVA